MKNSFFKGLSGPLSLRKGLLFMAVLLSPLIALWVYAALLPNDDSSTPSTQAAITPALPPTPTPTVAGIVPGNLQGIWSPDCNGAATNNAEHLSGDSNETVFTIGAQRLVVEGHNFIDTHSYKIIDFVQGNNSFVLSIDSNVEDDQTVEYNTNADSTPSIQILVFNTLPNNQIALASIFDDTQSNDTTSLPNDTTSMSQCDTSAFASSNPDLLKDADGTGTSNENGLSVTTATGLTAAPDPIDPEEIAASQKAFSDMPAVNGVKWSP